MLSCVTYNMHGFRQGYEYLVNLCSDNDIVFIQEHWLAPFDLHKLNTVADDMICFASTAMSDIIARDCLSGRPFGGVAVYIKQNLASKAKLVSSSKRYVIVLVGQLLLVNVYLPCASTVDHVDEYIECLASIMNEVSDLQFHDVIFGGDLNMELNDNSELCRHLHSFVHNLQLKFVDDKISSNDKFTYRVESTGACSVIDHFAISYNLYQRINNVKIVDSAVNFSDHCPVLMEVDVSLGCSVSRNDVNVQSKSSNVLNFRWDIGDCSQYYMLTYDALNCIQVPVFLLDSNVSATMMRGDILDSINQYYRDIVKVLFDCACACIPQKKHGFYKFWWDQELTLLKEAAIRSFNIWKIVGKPRSGLEFDTMRRDKLRYKLSIREKERCNGNSFSDSLNDALNTKDMDSFWRTWRSKFSSKQTPSVIDGYCNESDISNRFAEVFKDVCVPNSADKHEQLRLLFCERFMHYNCKDASSDFINVELVQKTVGDLKRGKAAGLDGLMAEHVYFAHPALLVHLSCLFSMLYKHSIVPDDFGRGIVIPLLKNIDGNRFTTDNYRGITLSPVISKLFEMVLLSQFKDQLVSDPLQFGFKAKTSCSHAIFTFKTVIDYYIRNDCNVTICALDISKAFDRVDHYKLFCILMDRSLPKQFIALLFDWFSKCFSCVRWGTSYSCWFQIFSGVRQGGILSPILFAVYMDPLITQLRRLGLGCRLLNDFYGCLLYADDILLMTHSIHAMQMMLHVCDTFADDFDIRFNNSKSVVLRIGKRFSVNCAALQIDNKDIKYVRELKYLGVHVIAAQHLKFSLEHVKLKFYRTFNCIYAKSNAANSEMVTVELLKSYCLPFMLYCVEAISLSSGNIRSLDNCINRAMYRIFGSCDKSSLEFLRMCTKLDNMTDLIQRKRDKFVDQLIHDGRFTK